MKTRFLIILPALAVLLSACTIHLPIQIKPSHIGLEEGSGNVVTKDFRVGSFNQVTLNGVGELEVTFGSQESLRVEAEDNVIDKINASVEEGMLTLSYSDYFRVVPTQTITFRLTAKQLEGLILNGAGEISIMDINGDHLEVTINGAGVVTVSGRVDSQKVTFNGAGSYRAEDLQSKDAQVTLNGVGNGTVWVSGNLEAQIDGVGNLQYYGSPRLTQRINGAGSVEGKGERK